MENKITTPLSGEMRFVGVHLNREIFDYIHAEALHSATTNAATIRTMLLDHLRNVGVVAPKIKGPGR